MSKSKEIFGQIREKQINSVVELVIPSHLIEDIKYNKKKNEIKTK